MAYCFQRVSPALKELLLKIHRAERPQQIDHHIHEFGSVHYHVQCLASDPGCTYLSISTPVVSRGLPLASSKFSRHTIEIVEGIFRDVVEIVEPPNEGYQLTLKLNLERIPHVSTKIIANISSVQALILSSQLKQVLKNIEIYQEIALYKPIKLTYHPKEPFFLIKQAEKMTAIFPMRFKEDEDVVIATTFFQELVDAGNSNRRAPRCMWSPIPPPELRGEPIEDLCTNSGFVSFDITSKHVRGKKLDKTVWNLLNFNAFVKHHVKTTRSFIQRRMRMRLQRLVQPLQNVRIEEEAPVNKVRGGMKGCTKVKKWISASKQKILKRRYDLTKKMKRIRSRIKIHGFIRFRRKWLPFPKFSPVTRYIKLE
ncbi:actin-related protein 2/3 complex subunit 2B isoform X2 [Andrographis paniculata]|uniref:actin-related protein 2/3 complex subunit 2B isoform X2 n=1 Tax=Andrographis paniculata TaxID=175694 RepID=UPI0021E743CC|nr:actin-related protein 2/3 complex subunit 2B isoform X2 [Andrographis paniculata]